jgi:UDP-N-acetyl-D-glucosamine dehydrogenase
VGPILKGVFGTRILLLGLAYKAGTSDWREFRVISELLRFGADVRVHDQHVQPQAFHHVSHHVGVPSAGSGPDDLAEADLVVLFVDHPDLPYDDICRHSVYVFDGKGALRGREFARESL